LHTDAQPIDPTGARGLRLVDGEALRVCLHRNLDRSAEIDVLPDETSTDPVMEAQKADIKEFVHTKLTRAERLIVVLYYYEQMTMKEIGATLDLSESRVSQMHSAIIKRLRTQLSAGAVEALESGMDLFA
ncbi:MAG: sigma-70 family RNA polymerase sigma factor, partial [Planctomycetota bacterium]